MTMAIKGGASPDSFLMWPLLPVVTGPSCWPLWVSTYRAVVSMAHALPGSGKDRFRLDDKGRARHLDLQPVW